MIGVEPALADDAAQSFRAGRRVVTYWTPLVEDPKRVGAVRARGVDEHAYLAANPAHSTIYETSLVDLDRRRVIDLFERHKCPEAAGMVRQAFKAMA